MYVHVAQFYPPGNWDADNGNEYFFSSTTATRDAAETCCESAGAHLTSITSSREQSFVRDGYVHETFDNTALCMYIYMISM